MVDGGDVALLAGTLSISLSDPLPPALGSGSLSRSLSLFCSLSLPLSRSRSLLLSRSLTLSLFRALSLSRSLSLPHSLALSLSRSLSLFCSCSLALSRFLSINLPAGMRWVAGLLPMLKYSPPPTDVEQTWHN